MMGQAAGALVFSIHPLKLTNTSTKVVVAVVVLMNVTITHSSMHQQQVSVCVASFFCLTCLGCLGRQHHRADRGQVPFVQWHFFQRAGRRQVQDLVVAQSSFLFTQTGGDLLSVRAPFVLQFLCDLAHWVLQLEFE